MADTSDLVEFAMTPTDQLIESTLLNRPTANRSDDHLIDRVWGNLQIEHPEITREMVKNVLKNRKLRLADGEKH